VRARVVREGGGDGVRGSLDVLMLWDLMCCGG
jgi:hypothetical protein